MTKKIVWRLKETPTSENLRELVKDQILSKEEAREILFSEIQESERDIESFKQEIRFLREMVEKLSNSRTQIVEVIKECGNQYNHVRIPGYTFYQPYITWCDYSLHDTINSSFSSIKTF